MAGAKYGVLEEDEGGNGGGGGGGGVWMEGEG